MIRLTLFLGSLSDCKRAISDGVAFNHRKKYLVCSNRCKGGLMMMMKIFIDRNYVAAGNSRYIVHLHKHCTPCGLNSLYLGHDFTYHKL